MDDLTTKTGQEVLLAEMIESLRVELSAATNAGADKPLRFEVANVELELEIKLSKKLEGEGGIKFWVVNAGGKSSSEIGQTHKFKLSLKPNWKGGKLEVAADATNKNLDIG